MKRRSSRQRVSSVVREDFSCHDSSLSEKLLNPCTATACHTKKKNSKTPEPSRNLSQKHKRHDCSKRCSADLTLVHSSSLGDAAVSSHHHILGALTWSCNNVQSQREASEFWNHWQQCDAFSLHSATTNCLGQQVTRSAPGVAAIMHDSSFLRVAKHTWPVGGTSNTCRLVRCFNHRYLP